MAGFLKVLRSHHCQAGSNLQMSTQLFFTTAHPAGIIVVTGIKKLSISWGSCLECFVAAAARCRMDAWWDVPGPSQGSVAATARAVGAWGDVCLLGGQELLLQAGCWKRKLMETITKANKQP